MKQICRSRGRALAALAALAMVPSVLFAQGTPPGPTTASTETGTLKVCGDPDNLPLSNERREGLENKIAEVIARALGDTVAYTWWPQRRGFVRNTLRSRLCDVLIGVPGGFDPVAETRPMYRSMYVVVSRADRNLRIESLDDPALRRLKIGVHVIGEDYTNTPPAHALGARGIRVHGYSTFYNEEDRPEDIFDAVGRGEIDVAVVWGPLAGYYATRGQPPLAVVPLRDSVDASTGFPLAYDIGIGVRRSDRALRAQLDSALVRSRGEIDRILREYGVPVIPRE